VWNIEQAGSNRDYRIIQKRGKIIDAEDFMAVRDTYPEFPRQEMESHTTRNGHYTGIPNDGIELYSL
jgi:hypothetical protein